MLNLQFTYLGLCSGNQTGKPALGERARELLDPQWCFSFSFQFNFIEV